MLVDCLGLWYARCCRDASGRRRRREDTGGGGGILWKGRGGKSFQIGGWLATKVPELSLSPSVVLQESQEEVGPIVSKSEQKAINRLVQKQIQVSRIAQTRAIGVEIVHFAQKTKAFKASKVKAKTSKKSRPGTSKSKRAKHFNPKKERKK